MPRLISLLTGIDVSEGARTPKNLTTSDLAKLFRTARKSIHVVSGRLPMGAYFAPSTADALKNAKTRGVKVEIITSKKANKDGIKALDELGCVINLIKHPPAFSFCVVDEMHVRLEDPHPLSYIECRQYIAYNSGHARDLEIEFKQLMKSAKKYKPR